MRFGGPVFLDDSKMLDPVSWVQAVKAKGYRAAYCPIQAGAGSDRIRGFERAAREADLVIAEVGAWSNPLSQEEAERAKAIAYCQSQLALADEVGAHCCVNIAGSCGRRWDCPHPANLTADTFALIVDTVRSIIDAVHPTRTYYTLEPMPWMYPDSPDSYLALHQAIDREHFGVHLDPVNMICSPQRYFQNGAFIRECFEKLGPYIRSCHAKDTLLADTLTTHLDEARPGLGSLDYRTLLTEMNRLHPDTPLMLEHLQKEEDYDHAAVYVRSIAGELGILM